MSEQDVKVFTSGSPECKPVVFIHGFPYDHHMWDKQVNMLNSQYYCITYDIRGLGVSPAGDGQFTLESFVDDLEFIITEYRLEKPVICGLSMGGYILFRAAVRMQNKLGALVFCDTKAEADTNEGKLKRAESIKNINKDGVQKFVSGFVPSCFSENFINNSAIEYKEILSRALNSGETGVKGCQLAMLGRTDTTEYLTRINIPTLVICGEADKLTPPDAMKKTADLIKNSEFAVIPGAGHVSAIENPVSFNSNFLSFLKKNFG